MPEFGHPFSGLKNNYILSDTELVRSLRFLISTEFEAVQLYMQLADSTENQLVIDVLTDIANEERIHAGEFLRLLEELAPDEMEFYAQGAREVDAKIINAK